MYSQNLIICSKSHDIDSNVQAKSSILLTYQEESEHIIFRSQIRTLDYRQMKDLIVREMGKSNDISYKKMSDEDLLTHFHDCRS